MHVFGLTGGIGSGKSTVAARFRARRLPIVDADALARESVAKGSEGLALVVAAFGDAVLDTDGELDRKEVARRVFQDPEARRALNAIVHPRVGALSAAHMKELSDRGEPLACYEVPLLFEAGLDGALRPVVVVAAPVSVQIERTTARDGTTEDLALARIAAQLPLEEKVRRADYVIDNSGTLDRTIARADSVLDAICERLGIDRARYPLP